MVFVNPGPNFFAILYSLSNNFAKLYFGPHSQRLTFLHRSLDPPLNPTMILLSLTLKCLVKVARSEGRSS